MKTKKTPFFIKFKKAIFNFDEYIDFLEEKTSKSIKYLLKLLLIFTIVITIAATYKVLEEVNTKIIEFKDKGPEFTFKDNNLVIEGENQRIIKGDEFGYVGFILDTQIDNLNDVEEKNYYQRVISVLKDRIIIRDIEGIESTITYEQLNKKFNLSNINKQNIIQFLSRK
jgi:hypothetical protein